MGTNWNDNLTLNLYTAAQGVQRTDFGTLAFASTGATFSPTFRNYADPQAVSDDDDLSAALKSALDFFFDQDRHQKQITVVKVASYADYDTSLDAAAAAMTAVPYMWVTEDRTDDNHQGFVDWATTNKKLAYIQSNTPAVASGTGIFDTMNTAAERRAFTIYHHDDTEFVDLGIATYFGADNPDNTSTIAAYRTLRGCTPQGAAFGATEKTALDADSVNVYSPFYGNNVLYPGKVASGTWVDEVVVGDWFSTRVEEAIAQLLLDAVSAGSKVPFNKAGIKLLEGAIRSVAQKGYRLGHFEADSLVFNTKDYSDYSSSELQLREATIAATVTLSGAIQKVTINLGLVYAQ